ncbi:MAG: hypothetical protein K0R26_1225 [Bacteroidota bacterium]|jgi:hypothetical protein|nr:hypothetical protein [Bacteroidota bacterium]
MKSGILKLYFFVIVLAQGASSYSQCTSNTSLYPSATFTPNCNGTSQNITTSGWATDYSMVYVTSGITYTFSSSVSTDFLTIANAGGGAPVYAFGTTPVVWTAAITGNVRFYNNTNSSCGTSSSNRTRSVKCGTPPPPPSNDDCSFATSLPCGTSNLAGTTVNAVSETAPSGCASAYGVWYTFVGDGQSTTISSTAASGFDHEIDIFSGNCGSLANIACVDNNGSGSTESYSFLSINGTTYYVYVAYYTSGTTTGNFTISRTCIAPPSNDACSGATSLPCGTSNLAGTTVGAVAETAPGGCASAYGVWYTFTGNGQSTTISSTAASGFDHEIDIFSGSCGSLTNISCVDNNGSGSNENYTFTSVNGTTYYVYVAYYTSGSTTGNFTISRTCTAPPINDACSGATSLPCGTTNLAGTTIGAVSETAPGGCASAYGVWYTFTGNGQSTLISSTGASGFDHEIDIFSGSCGSITTISCVDDAYSGGTEEYTFSTINGTTYYVYVAYYTTGTTTGSFTISRTCITPPSNDDCPGATSITPNSGTTCSSLVGGTVLGASSSFTANGCGGTADDDVWYSFVATSSTHSISITNIAGSTSDMYHSLYSGSCASIGSPILCSDPNNSSISGLILGNTYYVRVYTWTSTPGQTSTFSVCIKTAPPVGACGNPSNNDFCSNPATLTQGAGTFSSTTSSTYSSDLPGNISSVFCGSIENNSWYQFVATGTTASFPFTSVNGCTWNDGVQAQVYKVSTNASGCCTSFTSVSNCYNPGTTSSGTVTATGLVAGQTYILMVDGYAGDVCNFTVSGWTAVGILPMELLTFVGHNEDLKNKVQWVTATEKNTAFFDVEKSKDGVTFEALMRVEAAGFSTSAKNYNVFDMTPFPVVTYYRLKLVNGDNSSEYSNMIAVDNTNLTNYISNARPNPTNGDLLFDVNLVNQDHVNIELYNNTGKLMMSEIKAMASGYHSLNLDLKNFESGIFLLKISLKSSDKSVLQKIIKQ